MSLGYKPTYFRPEEIISPAIFEICGPDALYMYDPQILRGMDAIRQVFGPMIANTWHSEKLIAKYGLHRFRGLRAKNQKIGARLSAHKIGIKKYEKFPVLGKVPYSAIDLDPVKVTPQHIHAVIKESPIFWSTFFTRIETHKPNGDPITWFHGDNKPHDGKTGLIKFFRG